ncbi:type I restriction endonuclease subunit R [Saccharothrix sp. S26]|uniref:type I restriction endonuclease subunit R n=1 Tax=Saccharothrix sp. S26 TaxID=2907215 RepID=UPI001F306E84|nr:type I restriction endonuclease subunit R [Saccharothrix sp. S26]MCE6993304.1 type I restriction endonuclease subunit R [Saccharothrix sp. S26]
MTFNEANTVRDFVRDLVASVDLQFVPGSALPRRTDEVMLEAQVRAALIRMNPEIAADPRLADEVIHKLQAVIVSARHSPNPVVANEEFAAWLTGQKSMPFGPDGAHTTVRLIDFENGADPSANHWIVSTEVTYGVGRVERRFDLVLWCNGFPLVVGEAKSPVRPAYTWIDAAAQINEDYEVNVPAFFVPNVLNFATEGKDFRYGSVGMPVELWGPWREEGEGSAPVRVGLASVREAVEGVLTAPAVLDFLRFFTLFATDKNHRKIKIIARFQQLQATNAIVERVLHGRVKQGLIWHFQGSGKSLLMVFTAQKLRATAGLSNPTVLIVVDRIDLDTQITATFNASDVPNLVSTDSRKELQELLGSGARKVIITTVHKFGEAPGVLDDRSNIILMVDEAHRSQEGDFGRKMRTALPNAFLFGLTGTPVNRRDRNTFLWFGSEDDEGGYLSRYTFQDAIRDGATLPLHFEPRLSDIHLDEDGINTAFEELTAQHQLSEADKIKLSRNAASIEALIKTPERVREIAADIAEHFRTKVEPQGLKAQVVVYDKPTCVAYKAELDALLGPDASIVVMSRDARDPQEWKEKHTPDREELERITARFNDPADPLKIIIVTAKLLTGFDAPILYAQYLDKPLKEHNLLQAITRTNRVYPPLKTHGLIVDYLGIFDDVAKAFAFDDKSVQQVISNIAVLRGQLAPAIQAALAFFPGVDRTAGGYEGLIQAQTAIAGDEAKDAFAAAYSVVAQLWETLSPDPILREHEADYRWLTDVYESVRPSDVAGRLVWHTLGAKTLALINEHVTVEVPRTDLDTIVLDAHVIEDLMTGTRKDVDPVEVEKWITIRISKHVGNPTFIELGKRLNALREKYANAQQASLEFLKELFELARDTVAAEKVSAEVLPEERGKASLTELFESLKNDDTPIIVEKVVNEVDEVIRTVRFDGWQNTRDGDRQVQQALRKTLYIKFKIRDNDVFERALGYIREHY